MQFGEEPLSLAAAPGDRRRRAGLRVRRGLRQRPLRLPDALARRADGAREHDRALGGDGRWRRRSSLAVLRGPVQLAKALAAIDVLSEGPADRRRRPGLLRNATTRCRRSRSRSAGSDSTRRSPAARLLAAPGSASPSATPTRARSTPAGDPALGRELGLACRARARREAGRRLARLRLQHDAGGLRRRSRGPGARARGARPRTGRLPERARDDVDLGIEGPRRGRSRARRRPGAAPAARSRRAAHAGLRRTRGHCAELLARYAEAGCERVYLWPLGDEPRQLELIAAAWEGDRRGEPHRSPDRG